MPILMPSTFCPMENGDSLVMGQDRNENIKEIARHSKHDADAYDQYSHDITMVIRAVKPLFDKVPPNLFDTSPEGLAELADLAKHLRGDRADGAAQPGAAADRQRRRLPRRLLRVRHPQGLALVVGDHRHQGRADVAGLGARAAVPQHGRARRQPRLVGVPQGRQRRLHAGAGRAPPRRSVPRSSSTPRSSA